MKRVMLFGCECYFIDDDPTGCFVWHPKLTIIRDIKIAYITIMTSLYSMFYRIIFSDLPDEMPVKIIEENVKVPWLIDQRMLKSMEVS